MVQRPVQDTLDWPSVRHEDRPMTFNHHTLSMAGEHDDLSSLRGAVGLSRTNAENQPVWHSRRVLQRKSETSVLVSIQRRATAFVSRGLIAATMGLLASGVAVADDSARYPNQPVRVVVGFSAGSAVDIASRVIGEKLSERWKQPVVTENRPGASGALAAQSVARSKPDGYTLLAVSAAHVISPALSANVPYKLQDFSAVSSMIAVPSVLVVKSSLGVKSTKELIELAKAKPGQLMFSSGGTGSGTHFAAELFKSRAGVDVRHVPYRGIPEALTEVVAGRIDFTFTPLSSALPLLKSGEIVALAVAPATRVAALPDIPTLHEAGLTGYRWDSWFGLLAPAQTPSAIVKALNTQIAQIVLLPDVKKRWETLGAEAMTMTPEEFERYLADQAQLVAELVKAANIQAK
jgi:tripartite-type tricarboxylate transporter receptor subunit TctC